MNTPTNRPFDTTSPQPTGTPAASRSISVEVARPSGSPRRHRQGRAWCSFLALLFIALLGSATAASAQDATTTTGPEGSWLYTVTIPDFGSFLEVETYGAGGTYSEADQLSFMPTSVASTGHGAWQSKGTRKFLMTYVNLTFDGFSTGNLTGTLKVRQRAKVAKDGNSYSGSGDYTYFDTAGNVVLTGPFTITATRIGVEAPAAQ